MIKKIIETKKVNVSHLHPEIVKYWLGKGMPKEHIDIFSCDAIEEDCLYLYGRFYSYCRYPIEWKMMKDLSDEELDVYRKNFISKGKNK